MPQTAQTETSMCTPLHGLWQYAQSGGMSAVGGPHGTGWIVSLPPPWIVFHGSGTAAGLVVISAASTSRRANSFLTTSNNAARASACSSAQIAVSSRALFRFAFAFAAEDDDDDDGISGNEDDDDDDDEQHECELERLEINFTNLQ